MMQKSENSTLGGTENICLITEKCSAKINMKLITDVLYLEQLAWELS